MSGRRHVRRPADLTSLLDVLFIVVFASLIRVAAVQTAAARGAPAPPPSLAKPAPVAPVMPANLATLRARALADLDVQLAARTPLVIRVAAAGTIYALEVESKRIGLDVPLLEHSPDPDIAVTYLGDRSAELRLCRVAALHLGVQELSGYLVIVAPTRPLADLPHALYEGLHRDLERCLSEQHGLAIIVDPTAVPR